MLGNRTGMFNLVSEPVDLALHEAAKAGEDETVGMLLTQRPHLLDSSDSCGRRPLHLAALAGSQLVVERLLAANCKVDGVDANGNTALHIAAMRGFDAIASQLLAHSPALIDAVNQNDENPLHKGATFEKLGTMFLELKPELIFGVSKQGNTVLHEAMRCPPQVSRTQELWLARILRMNLPAARAVNNSAQTPFHIAVNFDNAVGVTLLQWAFSYDEIMHAVAPDRVMLFSGVSLQQNLKEIIGKHCKLLLAPSLPNELIAVVIDFITAPLSPPIIHFGGASFSAMRS